MDQFAAFAERFFNWGFFSADVAFVACAIVLLGHLDKESRTVALRVLDAICLLVADFALSLFAYLAFGHVGSAPVLFVVLVAYALRQGKILTTDKIARCAAFEASFILLVGITGVLMPSIRRLVGDATMGFLPNLLSFVALLVIALFLRRFSVSGFRYAPRRYANLVVAICLVSAAVGYSFIGFNTQHQLDAIDLSNASELELLVSDVSSVNLLVDLALLALVLIAYYMFFLLSVEHEQRATRLVVKRTASDNAEMVGVTKSVYESMRELRHETKNRVAYMQALLDNGQYDRLRDYFSTFSETSSSLLNYVQSGNTIVDAVVNAKIALASSQGVKVKTMLAVPVELGLPEEDVYTVIANLMDNAIEGAVASGAEERVVKLSVRPEGGYYIVTAQNPCSGLADGSGPLAALKTTKADKEVHGYGTKVVSRIARRHKGTARYTVHDGVFTANVMLAQGGNGQTLGSPAPAQVPSEANAQEVE